MKVNFLLKVREIDTETTFNVVLQSYLTFMDWSRKWCNPCLAIASTPSPQEELSLFGRGIYF